jgi:hypothetical protein
MMKEMTIDFEKHMDLDRTFATSNKLQQVNWKSPKHLQFSSDSTLSEPEKLLSKVPSKCMKVRPYFFRKSQIAALEKILGEESD